MIVTLIVFEWVDHFSKLGDAKGIIFNPYLENIQRTLAQRNLWQKR